MSVPESLLRIENLHICYPDRRRRLGRHRRWIQAVAGVSLDLRAGETLGLVGESGSGKSTLLRAAIGMESPASGTITVFGRDVTRPSAATRRWLSRNVQLVLQDPYTSLNPRMSIEDVVAEGLDIHGLVDTGAERRRRVEEVLGQVGLDRSALARFPHEFSGGQQQRISIARALALDPKILLCDEPVSSLDVSVQAQVLNLLQDLRTERGISLMIVTHDLTVVDHMADRVAVLYLGRVVEVGPPGATEHEPHPYTRALRAAAPNFEAIQETGRSVLAGELPDPADPPSGCRFHTRCPVVQPGCDEHDPPLLPVADDHAVACVLAETAGPIRPSPAPTSRERNMT